MGRNVDVNLLDVMFMELQTQPSNVMLKCLMFVRVYVHLLKNLLIYGEKTFI